MNINELVYSLLIWEISYVRMPYSWNQKNLRWEINLSSRVSRSLVVLCAWLPFSFPILFHQLLFLIFNKVTIYSLPFWFSLLLFKMKKMSHGRRKQSISDKFSCFQRVGGSWDGYWLTESLLHDGDSFSGGVAY